MAPRYGVVGGTALRDPGDHRLRVETPWGQAEASYEEDGDREVVFLDRHAVDGRRVPAHRVPHQRNAWALDRAGVEAVVGVHAVGALDPSVEPGTLAVPDDLVDATGEPPTVHDDEVVHVAMDPPVCPRVRRALVEAGAEEVGAYVQTRGPRLETPAEVALLREAGSVVGMTAAAEAAVARELGLCYASLAVVANRAAGLAEEAATAEAIVEAVDGAAEELREAVDGALEAVGDGSCACPEAPERART